MKTLILTEKPSVARDFSKAILKNPRRKDGYIEDDKYIITWAVGHLVELFEPDDYDQKWKKWNFATLPVIPESFKYKPVERTKSQLKTIKTIISKSKIENLVIATDAGREGEVIARTILIATKYLNESGEGKVNISRFWTSQALTAEVIKDGLNDLKPSTSYDRLWKAGQCRQIADWLVGMNSSRAATLKMNDLFSVGRVQTAVLSLIVTRCKKRENFKPEPYYLLYCEFRNIEGSQKYKGIWFKKNKTRFNTLEDVNAIKDIITGKDALVKSVKRAKKKQPPPDLFSLTDLQREANTKFGFTAKKTLDVAQNLYETKKCLSYPRTDSKVLGSQNIGMTKNLVVKFSNIYKKYFNGVDLSLVSKSNKRVFNDAKLTDHHALIPLKPIPKDANEDENKIFGLVIKRFAAVFHNHCEFEQTEIVTESCGETFRTKGKVILNPGWKNVYKDDKVIKKKSDEEDQEDLPKVEKGDNFNVHKTDIKSKKTTPDPFYTEATLLKDMTNPGKYVEEKDLKKIYRGETGLGTQATRAQIIETLILRKYIERVKKTVIATDKGNILIETLKQLKSAKLLVAPEETARWEMELESIAQGDAESAPFIENIKMFVDKIVNEFKEIEPVNSIHDSANSISGCPACKGQVIENQKAFGCSNWKSGCPFVIWKKIAGKDISQEIAIQLIENKTTKEITGFSSKAGKKFNAKLRISEKDNWKVTFGFSDEKPVKPKIQYENKFGLCPSCGGIIIEGKKGYGCANWPESSGSCSFVIWKTISGKNINEDIIKILLEGKKTEELVFNPKTADEFKARLKLTKIPGNITSKKHKTNWETSFIY
ncbi:MAG: DNA topoisomerase III [Deltaproteobacteria bacterium]|nr:DNA topoisomerase III [Deltaproteobacteria bacterium]